jgi:uncharacterized protein YwqG
VALSFRRQTEEDEIAFADFDYEFAPRNPCHRVLGYSTPIVDDPAEAAAERSTSSVQRGTPEYFTPEHKEKRKQFKRDAHNWILLLQLDSDDVLGTMWGDVGTLFFLIHREDLKALRFDKVWMELQFT